MTEHGSCAAGDGVPACRVRVRRRGAGAALLVTALLFAATQPSAAAQPAGADARPASAAAQADAPCPRPDAGRPLRRISGPDLDIAWRPLVDPVPVGEPFAIEFEVCPRGPTATIDRLRVDAWMPEHRHGMNYRTTLSGTRPGPLRAEGLLFHMPGRWQVVFELRAGERALRLTDELTVR